jgi:transcriptional regulator with XRE-family HTH domain
MRRKSSFAYATRTVQRNRLWIYRKRMRYSQRTVALLLGHKTATHVSAYEHGRRLPSLETALKLELILRVPVAFLFQDAYLAAKRIIRDREERLRQSGSWGR